MFPVKQIKRVHIVKRADGNYCQFGVQAHRVIEHVPTGRQAGIDVGIASLLHRLRSVIGNLTGRVEWMKEESPLF